MEMDLNKSERMIKIMRRKTLYISHNCNLMAHIGSGLSIGILFSMVQLGIPFLGVSKKLLL